MDLGGGKGSFGEVCLSANVCVQSGFSLPQGEAPPPRFAFSRGLHIKFKKWTIYRYPGEGRLFQKIPLQYRAMRLNLRRPRTAGADNERFQRPNALASSEMMATVYSRILVLAAICPYALAFTGVPPSAMSSSYAHREPCPYNMQMPPRIGGPAQAAQAQEAEVRRQRKARPARAAIMPIVDASAEYDEVLAQAAVDEKLIVIKIHAKFCRACKMLRPKYQRAANTWAPHNVEFRDICFEDNRDFCRQVLGVTKLPTVQVLAPSLKHVESMTGNDFRTGKLDGSLRTLLHSEIAEEEFSI